MPELLDDPFEDREVRKEPTSAHPDQASAVIGDDDTPATRRAVERTAIVMPGARVLVSTYEGPSSHRVGSRAMPAPRRFDLDDLVNRPGTYFNPETEIVLVVDDSTTMESDLLADPGEGGDWMLIADDLPVDEAQRDTLLEAFQARHGGEATGATEIDDELVEDEEELEPDPDEDELR